MVMTGRGFMVLYPPISYIVPNWFVLEERLWKCFSLCTCDGFARMERLLDKLEWPHLTSPKIMVSIGKIFPKGPYIWFGSCYKVMLFPHFALQHLYDHECALVRWNGSVWKWGIPPIVILTGNTEQDCEPYVFCVPYVQTNPHADVQTIVRFPVGQEVLDHQRMGASFPTFRSLWAPRDKIKN